MGTLNGSLDTCTSFFFFSLFNVKKNRPHLLQSHIMWCLIQHGQTFPANLGWCFWENLCKKLSKACESIHHSFTQYLKCQPIVHVCLQSCISSIHQDSDILFFQTCRGVHCPLSHLVWNESELPLLNYTNSGVASPIGFVFILCFFFIYCIG